MRIVSACQAFICLCEEPADQGARLNRFNDALITLDDNKGMLTALWRTKNDRDEFARIVELAWSYHLEVTPVQHAVRVAV